MENNKTRTILTIAVLGVFLAAFTLWTVFKPADAASDDRNVIMLHDYLTPLLFAFAFIFILALYSAIARSYTLSTARMNSFSP